ncbi:unnamed protein product [Heterobilharzia americana]|nr:unnamed protein product [Heterobilharzia americana]
MKISNFIIFLKNKSFSPCATEKSGCNDSSIVVNELSGSSKVVDLSVTTVSLPSATFNVILRVIAWPYTFLSMVQNF